MSLRLSETSRICPLSYSQRALWFVQKLAPSNTAYNLNYTARAITAPGKAKPGAEAWQGAFQALLDRHSALRTLYPMVDGQPVQRIYDWMELDFEAVDATNWNQEDVDEWLATEARHAFDVENGPVTYVRILDLGPLESVVYFAIHHIVVDVPSIGFLFDELRLFLLTEMGADAPDLTAPEADAGDFALWEEALIAGAEGKAQWAWWQHQLEDLPILELPLDRPRPEKRRFLGGLRRFPLRSETRSALVALAEARGVHLSTVMVAGFQVFLARHAQQLEMAVGWPSPGRTEPRFQEVVGYFINPVLLRGDLRSNPNFLEHLATTKQVMDEALARQNLPFPLLVERLAPDRDLAHSPLYQVLMALFNDEDERLMRLFFGDEEGRTRFGDTELEPLGIPRGGAMLDLTINLVDAGGNMDIIFEWDRDLYETTTARRWEAHIQRLLQACYEMPEIPVLELPMLTEPERHQLVVEWSGWPQEGWDEGRLGVFEVGGPSAPAGVWGVVKALTGKSTLRRGRFLADGRLEWSGEEAPEVDWDLLPDAMTLESTEPSPSAVLEVFESPAPEPEDEAWAGEEDDEEAGEEPLEGIAVVGLAGRFPGAPDVDTFWRNLRRGVESVRRLEDAELLAEGVLPEELTDPNYVKAAGVLDDVELFDADFFGFNAREAALLDPQQRLFLEICWQALENAGQDPERAGEVGVFAGSSANTYFLNLFLRHHAGAATGYHTLIGNDKDFLATRASYKLGLTGPSINVQTACSTSLVAVHLACQSLLNGESDLALAGGVSVAVPQRQGYVWSPGGIMSPDGHCRSFDARAKGTVGGSGVGVVVLKRLEDAQRDGDPIRAVLRGTAVNNDGSMKAGYTAPGVRGQARVIADALALAGLDPEHIDYVETHGSATPLGDTIEVAALKEVFRQGRNADAGARCALGSVKSNLGHLDAAAGVTGLIKTILSLEHGELPPSLHFEKPNPRLGLEDSPFFVNASLRPWPAGTRRAGVSSFGLGGTNAHAVLEEAPPQEPSEASSRPQVVLVSARTPEALDSASQRLGEHLAARPDLDLADVAWTTQVGRKGFAHRRALLVDDLGTATKALLDGDPQQFLAGVQRLSKRPVGFLLTGLGEHYPGMARELYDREPGFRQRLDRCAELVEPHLKQDLLSVLFPADAPARSTTTDLRALMGRAAAPDLGPLERTTLAQPALFAVEVALAGLWVEWGVHPQALLGYSLGEYVAA